jgi:hypothetical protein
MERQLHGEPRAAARAALESQAAASGLDEHFQAPAASGSRVDALRQLPRLRDRPVGMLERLAVSRGAGPSSASWLRAGSSVMIVCKSV